ncbi:hypothetical protein ASPFODRAFT_351597 [Aspergillus luchuensis CBS 106.47]|uniref:Uncharacterized protein n=1 Tax=Aspergillus luchuensis (strain CBS 106.47) TaxID=1137211 RepID=A0A1M3T6A2_ASPLC|nr:hypothetical protein ASPFODRAFT_351597 [Aspergillus luchuensis CBS 106.47]
MGRAAARSIQRWARPTAAFSALWFSFQFLFFSEFFSFHALLANWPGSYLWETEKLYHNGKDEDAGVVVMMGPISSRLPIIPLGCDDRTGGCLFVCLSILMKGCDLLID